MISNSISVSQRTLLRKLLNRANCPKINGQKYNLSSSVAVSDPGIDLTKLSSKGIQDNYLSGSTSTLDLLKTIRDGSPATEKTSDPLAKAMIKSARKFIKHPLRPSMETLLNQFPLTKPEGLALMCLAESLIRVPDQATRMELLRDQLGHGNWVDGSKMMNALWLNSVVFGLSTTKSILPLTVSQIEDGKESLFSRLGTAGIDGLVSEVIRVMAYQFVMGETLPKAWKLTNPKQPYSFDMLGEAALTQKDASLFYARYWAAVDFLASKSGEVNAPSLSIKLSALHPRYELHHIDEVKQQLLPQVLDLVKHAVKNQVSVTIDAEEASRLELSLFLMKELHAELPRDDTRFLGMAVQAYQKRAPHVLDYISDLALKSGHPLPIRLVKGAYWDQEVKVSQQQGYPDYPVHTSKHHTDVSYLACAQKMLNSPNAFFPQFASHNPHTIASIAAMANYDFSTFEYQRLFGMGEGVYRGLKDLHPSATCRVYAPVGQFDQLLPYLVRRMIENGANTSFVSALGNPNSDDNELLKDPWESLTLAGNSLSSIKLPTELYGDRRNSKSINSTSSSDLSTAMKAIQEFQHHQWKSFPTVGDSSSRNQRSIKNPAFMSHVLGTAEDATAEDAKKALDQTTQFYKKWQNTSPAIRAQYLENSADLIEVNFHEFMYLLMREAGKNFDNAQNEIREAVDFLRYYARKAIQLCAPMECPGVTGEKNTLIRQGLGTFVCVSPWNFPLAIFIGQISAALVTGNTVIAKPAPETPLVAKRMVDLMFEAGVPREALALLPGTPALYDENIWSDARVKGVAFTGSTQAAVHINRTLAMRPTAAIAKVIAETGGQNAMIVDSSALLDQAITDVVMSAFDSAGQRCSACRVAYVQQDVYELFKEKLLGRMEVLHVDDPSKLHTDVGPVISDRAMGLLNEYIEGQKKKGFPVHQSTFKAHLLEQGFFIPPTVIEIKHISDIGIERFGPILHLIPYQKKQLGKVVEEINSTGYGLTFGIHTRVDERVERMINDVDAGNIYVNRNIIGATVESQPFGGRGLSGTGPKAGGPDYLLAFLSGSKTVSNNIAAKGGDVALFNSPSSSVDKK